MHPWPVLQRVLMIELARVRANSLFPLPPLVTQPLSPRSCKRLSLQRRRSTAVFSAWLSCQSMRRCCLCECVGFASVGCHAVQYCLLPCERCLYVRTHDWDVRTCYVKGQCVFLSPLLSSRAPFTIQRLCELTLAGFPSRHHRNAKGFVRALEKASCYPRNPAVSCAYLCLCGPQTVCVSSSQAPAVVRTRLEG